MATKYQNFIKKELKGKTGPGYKARFKAAVAKWNRSPAGRASKRGKPPKRQRRLSGGPPKKASTRTRRRSTTTSRSRTKGRVGKKVSGINTQKIMKYVRLAALAAPAAFVAMGTATPQEKIRIGLQRYTGFNMLNGTFDFKELAKGWGPYVGAVVTTYGIPKLAGLIRGA